MLKGIERGYTCTLLFRMIRSSVQCSGSIFVCSPRVFCLQVLVKLEDKEAFLVMGWGFAVFSHTLLLPHFTQLLPLWLHPTLNFTLLRLF